MNECLLVAVAHLNSTERGDPMSALRWTCKSLRRPAAELEEQGHPINHTLVGELLTQQKFSLQANSKTKEGGDNPDRDAQFCHIKQGAAALVERQPVISVDTKKKELVGAPRVKRSARHMQQCLPQLAGLVVSHTLCHLVQPTSARSVSSSDRGNDPERVIERSTPDDPDKPRKASARPRSVG
jgi:hypothetical protein